MSVARWSVERPVAVTMRIASLVVLGAICLTKLPVDLLPKVTIPTVAVSTSWPNVAPEDMETTITRPVEEAVSSVSNLYAISSTSTLGNSSVRVQFNWGTDIGQAAVDTLQLVEKARAGFPNDPTLHDPIVYKFDPSTLPIIIYGVTGIDDPVQLYTVLNNDVTPLLESADGVASATVTGGLQRSIMVDCDPTKMQAYGVSLSQISNRIQKENVDLPAGIARQGFTEYTIRAKGYVSSPQQIADLPIQSSSGRIVTIGMVAKVSDSHQEIRTQVRLDGKPAAGVLITAQSAANTVSVADAVDQKMQQIHKMYPQLKFEASYQQAPFIKDSVNDLKTSAMIGGSLAVLILLMFLRNWRSTLVVAMSIPTSIISSFALFYFAGFTLNTLSLSGLALSTGLIVDDAVVVLENIFRHVERDKKRAAEAAVSGATEITPAVVASTLTVIIVFFPLLMIQGQAGQMFTQFALVVIFSIAISLLDATTVVPMLASRLINEEEVEEEAHPELRRKRGKREGPMIKVFNWFGVRFNNLDASYHRGLAWAIRRRFLVVGGALAICALSFLLLPLVGTEMLPTTDSGNFTVNIKHPVGTAFALTDKTVKAVENVLLSNPDVQTVFSASGTNLTLRGSTTAQISYQGSATVQLKDNRKRSTQENMKLMQKQLSNIPGARIVVNPYDLVSQLLSGGSQNMEVDIFGQNYDDMMSTANKIVDELRSVPGLQGVDLGVQESTPEMHWVVDRQKAEQFGLSFEDVASTLNAATNGSLSSYYNEDGYQYPIYVEVPPDLRRTAEQLGELPVVASNSGGGDNGGGGGNGSGGGNNSSSNTSNVTSVAAGTPASQVLLKQVAKPIIELGPNQINRQNRQRYVSIFGNIVDRAQSAVMDDVSKVLDKMEMPNGIYWAYGLRQQDQAKQFSGLYLAIFLAIALIYMLLASQFESFIYPLVVLMSVPLCSVGVILALFFTNRAFGLTAFIGLLMLIGIVVKNGILLVDYTNQLRGRGLGRDDAILTAAPTRLRPILMTSSAAVLGMFPLALAYARGSEMEAPLATAVIGGLTTSTFLTLFVVPCVYTMFDDLARKIRRNKKDLAPSIVGPSVGAVEHKGSSDDGRPERSETAPERIGKDG
ncbi:MAG TPA: efflux RND transporter permease subunit [Fimbriimonas sp.]|nr:efflux RND transporter permease subunit [Fimbriimonas sp.]